ncbi:MAG: MBL fold metallo-hydrolase [Phycisphaeraceae bacterium]
MIEPAQKDDALLADIVSAQPGEGFALWWLGQSGFLIKHGEACLLFDPYLSDSLTQKYADTDKPHVRMTRNPIEPARLTGIDVVTSSHNHTDHLDAQTLGPLLAANPNAALVCPEANRQFVCDRLELDANKPIGLDAGEHVSIGPFTLHAVPAAHEELARDEHGRHHFLGYVARFGPWSMYHSGDTLWYDGIVDWLKPFDLDLALLPINGRRPERRVAGNLDGEQAADLAHQVGARCVVPCHYDMFTFNTEPPDCFIQACEKRAQPYRVPRCGERVTWP